MKDDIQVKAVETPQEMEAVKALRLRVFVQEQKVPPEEEFDEQDSVALHAIATAGGKAVGTGRLFTSGDGETHLGRMAVEKAYRRTGVGSLVLAFLEDCARRQGAREISLHAQTYARPFYEKSGYAAQGEPFMEVDIEHVRMTKRLL